MIENINELFSLEPNYFDRSFETLKKKPDALKELTSIQECLNDKYREATSRFEEIKQNGKSEEENEKALLEIEKEIKEAEAAAIEAEHKLYVKAILEDQEELKKLAEKKKQLELAVKMVNGEISVAEAGEQGKVKKIYPNEPCPCGSGKKYKKCCGRNDKG